MAKRQYGEPLEPVETELSGDGPKLFARAHRVDQASAAIVLLHGICEHSGRLANLEAGLVERGFSTFAIDLRGHGRSGDVDGRRVHIEEFDDYQGDVDRALAWARSQEPELPLFLVGHSMGGLIVLRHALLHAGSEVAGVVALAPPIRLTFWKNSQALIAAGLTLPTGGRFAPLGDGLLKRLSAKDLSRDPAVGEAFKKDDLVRANFTMRLITKLRAAGLDLLARAADVEKPILILHGLSDPITSAEGSRVFREFRSSHTTTCFYRGALHELHNELPDTRTEVLDDIVRWLEDRLAVHPA